MNNIDMVLKFDNYQMKKYLKQASKENLQEYNNHHNTLKDKTADAIFYGVIIFIFIMLWVLFRISPLDVLDFIDEVASSFGKRSSISRSNSRSGGGSFGGGGSTGSW